jgi:hypothetical protein
MTDERSEKTVLVKHGISIGADLELNLRVTKDADWTVTEQAFTKEFTDFMLRVRALLTAERSEAHQSVRQP